jgi:hypothetical protein
VALVGEEGSVGTVLTRGQVGPTLRRQEGSGA